MRAPPLRGAHLPGLVAELRAVGCDRHRSPADREAAAVELSRLAEAGVRGADPDAWWGLADISDDTPPVRPDRPVPISPSRIESFLKCEIRTLLADLGARDGDSLSASLGMLVHEVAALLEPDATQDDVERLLDERWNALDFARAWHAHNERERASKILGRACSAGCTPAGTKASTWSGAEREFAASVGDAQLGGRVDRLERDEEGRLVVIDLKTGKSSLKVDDVPTHPQLAAYQLAVELGGFGEGERSGGARLVQLAAAGKDPEQRQLPLAEADDPAWIRTEVERVAARMRGTQFTATVQPRLPPLRPAEVLPALPGRPAGDDVSDRRPSAPPSSASCSACPHRPTSRPPSSSRARTRRRHRRARGPARPRPWPRASCGSSPTAGVARRRARPDLHPQGRSRAGHAASGAGLRNGGTSSSATAPTTRTHLAALIAGEPTVLTYAAYAGRLVGEHALRVGAEPDARLISQAVRVAARRRGVAPAIRVGCRPTSGHRRRCRYVLAMAGQFADHLVDAEDVERVRTRAARVVRGPAAAARGSAPPTRAARRTSSRPWRTGCELLPLVREFAAAKARCRRSTSATR